MTTRAGACALLILTQGLIACSSKSSQPVGSSIAPTPIAAAPTLRLNGYVYDTAFRPIAGAAVEVIDGPQAGMALTSESNGHFTYTGTFPSAVTIRATKIGYAPATETARIYPAGAWVYFDLVSIVPAVDVAGNYLLTIAADPSCTMLPDAVRTRDYSVRVGPANTTTPVPGLYDAFATSGEFAPYGNGFEIGVSGDYVGITTIGEGPTLVEKVGENRYIAYSIDAGVRDVTSGATTIAAPFSGMIEYCELASPIGQYYDCSSSYLKREQCTAAGGLLRLTRR